MERTSALVWSVQTTRLAIGLRIEAHLLPVGDGEAELGENLFMWDGRVLFAPLVGFGYRFRFGGAEGVAVFVDHQLTDSGELAEPR